MNFAGVLVIGRGAIGSDAAGTVGGRSALNGTCLMCKKDKKPSDDDTGQVFSPV